MSYKVAFEDETTRIVRYLIVGCVMVTLSLMRFQTRVRNANFRSLNIGPQNTLHPVDTILQSTGVGERKYEQTYCLAHSCLVPTATRAHSELFTHTSTLVCQRARRLGFPFVRLFDKLRFQKSKWIARHRTYRRRKPLCRSQPRTAQSSLRIAVRRDRSCNCGA